MTLRQARRWIRGWWADQMRNGTIPDLPEEHFGVLYDEFGAESRRIADRIDPQGDPS